MLDAVGFAAAIFHRGVRHIRCPTTVLAQDDSGVGVKNGINAFGVKNLLGTFAPPFAVINDFAFLDVLARARKARRHGGGREGRADPRRGFLSPGWRREADALARFQPNALDTLIAALRQAAHAPDRARRRSVRDRIGAAARLRPLGRRTSSRALTRHALRHGEAVAIGVALDARYSVLAGLLPEGEDLRVLRAARAARLHAVGRCARPEATRRTRSPVLGGLADFQEHLGGELTITLLAGIGRGVEVHVMDA